MKTTTRTTTHDDPTATLVARRAALAAHDAREREARLAAAQRQEEARGVGAERVAATFGRFLRRTTVRPQSTPVPLLRRRGKRERAEPQQRRDAA